MTPDELAAAWEILRLHDRSLQRADFVRQFDSRSERECFEYTVLTWLHRVTKGQHVTFVNER